MTSSVGGGVPHAPISFFTSSGAAISTSDPPEASASFRALNTSSASPNDQ